MTASSKLWSWMNAHMYITVFVLTVITDFWANWYSYAIVHDWIVVQAFLGLALPFLNLPSILFFIDQKNMMKSMKMRYSMLKNYIQFLITIRSCSCKVVRHISLQWRQ